MNDSTPVIFIGSGEASVLERKTLIYSIRKNTPTPVKIFVFNGTHNTIETEGAAPIPAPMSLRAKYLNITEFSNYRFLIPQLCEFKGRAIWLDSDTISFGDLNDLFNAPMNGMDLLAKPSKGPRGDPRWGLSVALFDCERCRFDLDLYVDEISRGLYHYNDMQQMTEAFLKLHPFRLGSIDLQWNVYDELDERTQLIHYTNLHTQPWKFHGHPHGKVWFRYFKEAQESSYVTQADIETAIRRGYVRPDVRRGNTTSTRSILRNALSEAKATLRDALRRDIAR
jgi:lipopolysaccharide biosynthesis glycosyltransferase